MAKSGPTESEEIGPAQLGPLRTWKSVLILSLLNKKEKDCVTEKKNKISLMFKNIIKLLCKEWPRISHKLFPRLPLNSDKLCNYLTSIA